MSKESGTKLDRAEWRLERHLKSVAHLNLEGAPDWGRLVSDLSFALGDARARRLVAALVAARRGGG